jgi:phosphoadenosine phosphosulfate reductase
MAAPPESRADLAALAADAALSLEGEAPQTILTWALEKFGDDFCVSASMSDAVVVDMASRIYPGVNVVFLDTGYHFPETLETAERVAAKYPITLHRILPKQTVEEQDEVFGPQLHDRDPDACCNLRKVEPLRRSLEPYAAWASGIRRDETPNRAAIGVVQWDSNRHMVKVNPLAAWTQELVDAYIIENDVVVNDLIYQGYPSIGCAPCTRKVMPGEDPRSGRWAGRGKTECGLHISPDGTVSRANPS